MADLGPGRYDIPDEWQAAWKPVCGAVRPSSFMMSKTGKGLQFKEAVGQDNFDNSSTEAKGERPLRGVFVRSRSPTKKLSPSRHKTDKESNLRHGFAFPKGSKSALDNELPSDLPVYYIRVRDVHTGEPQIIQVNSLSDPPPEGFINQETWANECLDGGSSLSLKKEPLPPLNPLDQDIDISVPDVALVPMPVTPLKKSIPCSPVQVKQMQLTTGTDVLYISPNVSPNTRGEGQYLSASTHSLESSIRPSQQHVGFDLDHAEYDSSGLVDWNHPIAKLHIPTTAPRTSSTVKSTRPKTKGQSMLQRTHTQKPEVRQSEQDFSMITNRSRAKFKKIPMHIADVASIKPTMESYTNSNSIHSSNYKEDNLGGKHAKLKESTVLTASANSSTVLNSLSESRF